MSTYKQSRTRTATNTFTIGEMHALLELLTIARRGGDTRVVMRSPTIARVERKFRSMATATEARAAQGDVGAQREPAEE